MLQNLMHLCQKKKDNQLKISTNIIFKSQKKKIGIYYNIITLLWRIKDSSL